MSDIIALVPERGAFYVLRAERLQLTRLFTALPVNRKCLPYRGLKKPSAGTFISP